ncbi:Protein of unknown function [Pyronema omphalodes CBS 100304]|uniref:Uncharacterized protein n=1 Tax=Pyronema omphalodes (strain CBS 100304) TaxID=1076935 RepID=U4L3J8_PYROM|nr:Protein of unknown function [Pyronema omphalodes CBS 100304]
MTSDLEHFCFCRDVKLCNIAVLRFGSQRIDLA